MGMSDKNSGESSPGRLHRLVLLSDGVFAIGGFSHCRLRAAEAAA